MGLGTTISTHLTCRFWLTCEVLLLACKFGIPLYQATGRPASA